MTPRPLEEVVKDVVGWGKYFSCNESGCFHCLLDELRASLAEREKEKGNIRVTLDSNATIPTEKWHVIAKTSEQFPRLSSVEEKPCQICEHEKHKKHLDPITVADSQARHRQYVYVDSPRKGE